MTGPSAPPVAAIVFDKDGTLFDFKATWSKFATRVIGALSKDAPGVTTALERALGFDLASETFSPDSIVIAGTAGQVAEAIFSVMPDRPQAEILRQVNATAAEVPQVPAVDLVAFLGGLAARGLALGVATNDAEAPARAHLEHAGIDHCLDFIAGYDSGHGAKPGPGQLLAFAAAIGQPPAACVMVGDSLHDLRAARAAGMRAVAVLTGIAERNELAPAADIVLASIAELPAWLDGL